MIRIRGLVKRYGAHAALDGVDLDVPVGAVYGLAGPNGAGKTTLLGIVADLKKSTAGKVTIEAEPGEVAVLPDAPRFDPWLTGREVVELALALGSPGGTGNARRDANRVAEALSQSGLSEAADRHCDGYSRGMLQRLGIACTLVARPTLILLSTSPRRRQTHKAGEKCWTSSPPSADRRPRCSRATFSATSKEVCDTVGILHHGRLLFQRPLTDLLVGRAVPHYVVRLRTKADADAVVTKLAVQPWVHAATGVPVVSLAPEDVSLERAFLELTSRAPGDWRPCGSLAPRGGRRSWACTSRSAC